MPHDGYHYSLSQLRMFPEPDDSIYRRGAPDTFDAAALRRDLDRIRNSESPIVSLPGFDHSKGDPEPDRHVFDRYLHDIVICEGLYLLHDSDGWEGISDYLDFTIFLQSDVDACIARLKVRNRCIPGYTPTEIAERCERVDRANAEMVVRGKHRAQHIVPNFAETLMVVTHILEDSGELAG
jgi:pantothenate kinase